MTERTVEEQAIEEPDVCPHCGSVVELAHAMEKDRSVLKGRAPARDEEA